MDVQGDPQESTLSQERKRTRSRRAEGFQAHLGRSYHGRLGPVSGGPEIANKHRCVLGGQLYHALRRQSLSCIQTTPKTALSMHNRIVLSPGENSENS